MPRPTGVLPSPRSALFCTLRLLRRRHDQPSGPGTGAAAARAGALVRPGTWPGGQVPAAGAAVTIAAGRTVLLDVSPPPLAEPHDRRCARVRRGGSRAHGRLDRGHGNAPCRARRPSRSCIGRPSRSPAAPTRPSVMGMGNKVLGVTAARSTSTASPARLDPPAATAPAGATQLQLERTRLARG